MRLICYRCGKAVSNELPEDTTVRAALFCPECIGEGAVEVHSDSVPKDKE